MAENVIKTVDLPTEAAPGPMGLLQLSEIFERAGHVKLAAYLRRCGDVVAVATSKPVGYVVYPGFVWSNIPNGQEVTFIWSAPDNVGVLAPGQYALVWLPGDDS